MSEELPNEMPELKIRSREVSEEDREHARAFEEESSFEHTVDNLDEEMPVLDEEVDELPASELQTEAPLVIEPPKKSKLSLKKTNSEANPELQAPSLANSEAPQLNVAALTPNEKAPSDLDLMEAVENKPLKLAIVQALLLHQNTFRVPSQILTK